MKKELELPIFKIDAVSTVSDQDTIILSFSIKYVNSNRMYYIIFTDCVLYQSFTYSEFEKLFKIKDILESGNGLVVMNNSKISNFLYGHVNVFNEEKLTSYILISKEAYNIVIAKKWVKRNQEGLSHSLKYFNEQINKHSDGHI